MKTSAPKNHSSKGCSSPSFFKKISEYLSSGLFKTIAKHSILPATIFNPVQLNIIQKEFDRFWGVEEKKPRFRKKPNFSTFTLGAPTCLWSHYFPTDEAREDLRCKYTPIPFKCKAKDGAKLCGMYFQSHRSHLANARTLIVFNGNGELYRIGSAAWLFNLLKDAETPFNIVMFDHRETGNSSGKAHPKGLVLDGEAIYNFVNTVLDVHEDNIDLCGFSLGGAIATLVKARHKDTGGALISNRSFYCLESAVKGIFSKLCSPLKKILSPIAATIAKKSGWVLDPFKAWQTITSRKMVICHQEDPVVHHTASLGIALEKRNLTNDCLHVRLVQKNPSKHIKNHHVQPLSDYNDHKGKDVEKSILEFLLKSDQKSLERIS